MAGPAHFARAGALGGSVVGQEPADVLFFRTWAECLHELGALRVVVGEEGCAASVWGRAPSAARRWSERRIIAIRSAGSLCGARCRMM